ncbi:MAG: DUF2062 domain-containing protein, partial [Pseudomonadota bacterium]
MSQRKPPGEKPHWTQRWKSSIPTRDVLAAHPWLKPVAHRVLDPQLWRLRCEPVARGAAIGVFWAFAIPFAQILAATVHSIWWRANIPVAAGITLLTNPLTVGFWLWLAYQTGALILGAPPAQPRADGESMMAWLASFGGPAILGMGIFAVGGAAVAYVGVKLAWRARIWF